MKTKIAVRCIYTPEIETLQWVTPKLPKSDIKTENFPLPSLFSLSVSIFTTVFCYSWNQNILRAECWQIKSSTLCFNKNCIIFTPLLHSYVKPFKSFYFKSFNSMLTSIWHSALTVVICSFEVKLMKDMGWKSRTASPRRWGSVAWSLHEANN